MRILVSGGSSFVGAHLCRQLARNHSVIALYYHTPVNLPGVESYLCDLTQADSVSRLRALNVDAVVHTAFKVQRRGISEGPDRLSKINRAMLVHLMALDLPLVYASSTVVHWPNSSQYARDRLWDENRLQQHSKSFDIIRPCAPFGPRLVGHTPKHKESFHTLVDIIARLPLVPVIGGGDYLRQPIYIDDFNHAIQRLLERGLTSSAYDAGGAEVLSFNAIIDAIAQSMGVCRGRLPIPKALFVAMASRSADFDPELIQTIDTDDLANPRALEAATGLQMRGFHDAVGALIS